MAVERFPGPGITGDPLNNDVLGRTPDAIAKYGPTTLFNEIVAKCLLLTEFSSHYVHVNTSGFSVTGEYDPEYDVGGVQITYGYPRDGRWNLKSCVPGMVSDQHGVPLFLQTFSGNESDKETFATLYY
ncbi:MAG: IS1634 family transposase [Methanogenium sp.]|nr:IS1634 family transposase [Methanogenium sp.]